MCTSLDYYVTTLIDAWARQGGEPSRPEDLAKLAEPLAKLDGSAVNVHHYAEAMQYLCQGRAVCRQLELSFDLLGILSSEFIHEDIALTFFNERSGPIYERIRAAYSEFQKLDLTQAMEKQIMPFGVECVVPKIGANQE